MTLSVFEIALSVVLMGILSIGFLLDGYAIYLRVAGSEGVGESLAMANLVQYVARISNVAVVFLLSIVFETARISLNISGLFLFASIFGFIVVVCLVRIQKFCNLITVALSPFLSLSFPKISRKLVWRDFCNIDSKNIRLGSVSAFSNVLIVVAMFIPFGIAVHYPEVRMTAVYVGQLINFFSTTVVFAIQDPISMRLIDNGAHERAGAALIYGRALSYLIAGCIFFLFTVL